MFNRPGAQRSQASLRAGRVRHRAHILDHIPRQPGRELTACHAIYLRTSKLSSRVMAAKPEPSPSVDHGCFCRGRTVGRYNLPPI